MISDIFLVLISTIMFLMHVLLLIPDTIANIGGLNIAIQGTISWLFSPLRYFGYWIDLQTLGIVINDAIIFLSVWYTFQLIRMAISAKSGELEQPTI